MVGDPLFIVLGLDYYGGVGFVYRNIDWSRLIHFLKEFEDFSGFLVQAFKASASESLFEETFSSRC